MVAADSVPDFVPDKECFVPDCEESAEVMGACTRHYGRITVQIRKRTPWVDIAATYGLTLEEFRAGYAPMERKQGGTPGLPCGGIERRSGGDGECGGRLNPKGFCPTHYQMARRLIADRAPLDFIVKRTGVPVDYLRQAFSLPVDYPETGDYTLRSPGRPKGGICFACQGQAKSRGACHAHYHGIQNHLWQGRTLAWVADHFGIDIGLLAQRFSDWVQSDGGDDSSEMEEDGSEERVVGRRGSYVDLTCNLLMSGHLGDGGRWVSFRRHAYDE